MTEGERQLAIKLERMEERLVNAAESQLTERAIEKTKREAAEAEVERLTNALEQISRMKTLPDDKTNTFTLAMVHKVASAALSNSGGS